MVAAPDDPAIYYHRRAKFAGGGSDGGGGEPDPGGWHGLSSLVPSAAIEPASSDIESLLFTWGFAGAAVILQPDMRADSAVASGLYPTQLPECWLQVGGARALVLLWLLLMVWPFTLPVRARR